MNLRSWHRSQHRPGRRESNDEETARGSRANPEANPAGADRCTPPRLGGAFAKLLEAVGVPAEQLRLATGAREVMRRWSLIHRDNARLLSNGFCRPWLAREADVLRPPPEHILEARSDAISPALQARPENLICTRPVHDN